MLSSQTSVDPVLEAPKDPEIPTRVIRPRGGLVGIHWGELWRYRELFGFFIWRDILVRYKQTYLGIAWVVTQPLLYMIVFSCVGHLAKFPTHGIPYPLICLAGLLPWQFFSTALSDSSSSLLTSSNIISKVYFPRLIVPASAILGGVVDFLVSFALFLLMELLYGARLRAGLLLIPCFFLYAVLVAFGAGVWFSALSVKYRDVKYVVPFLTRLGLYACPVAFISDIVPARWHFWYSLNPLVGIIDGFRWCAFGSAFQPDPKGLVCGFLMTVVFTAAGLVHFRTTERYFADLI
jgi:lipopolysaccharide transport system permease protein